MTFRNAYGAIKSLPTVFETLGIECAEASNLMSYVTSVNLELEVWNLVQCLLISFCFGSEILKLPQPPKKTQKPPKTLRIYMNLWKLCDYVTFVDLELEVWNLVQWSLISFCLGSEILVQF